MDNQIQTREIPKKSYIIIVILILLGIATYFITENGKSQKVTKILNSIGYTKIKDVKVYSITKMEDRKTKIQGFRYFTIFKNIATNEECKGYVVKDFKRKVTSDIKCKRIK